MHRISSHYSAQYSGEYMPHEIPPRISASPPRPQTTTPHAGVCPAGRKLPQLRVEYGDNALVSGENFEEGHRTGKEIDYMWKPRNISNNRAL